MGTDLHPNRMRALCLLAAALVASPVLAQPPGSCTLGTAQRTLDVSNVQASVFNNGNLFFGGSTTSGDGYLVPKISSPYSLSPIFASAIWIGGTVNSETRVSAARYGDYLFRPGPLNADGTLPNASDCSAFDRIWVVNVAEIDAYEAGGSPARDLAEWPVGLGAPTVDANGDPVAVSSPDQVIDLAAGERPDLHGSQTAFWVMNDVGAPRSGNQTAPLGVEVQVTAFVIADDALPGASESSFYRFTVINRSANTIENARFSFFTDPDLGGAGDDYMGTDTTRGMAFVYNSHAEDSAYGIPPAIGFDLLSGLAATSTFIGGGIAGVLDPGTPTEYYNYMQGLWADGSQIRESGIGFNQTQGDITTFMYTGDPVTGAFWSEVNPDEHGPSPFGDRRAVGSANLETLAPGDTARVDVGVLFAQGTDYLDSITELRAVSDGVQAAYDAGTLSQRGGDLAILSAPVLIGPDDDSYLAQVDTLEFEWQAVQGAEGYQIKWDTSATGPFVKGITSTETSLRIAARNLISETGVHTVFWRVTALASGAIGVPSDVRSATIFRGGALVLSSGQLGYVEVAAPGGADPCGASAASTTGCDEVFGNPVYHSLNSTAEYYFSEAMGSHTGSEATIGEYAPNDFEIRFTETGSLGAYRFQDGNIIRVPFEVWDIGPVKPGQPNDPADDVRLIPVLFADNAGTCAFDAAEVPDGQATFGGYVETDRIYAYYPATSYADFEAAFAGLVETASENCYADEADAADAFIDFNLTRPIQRQVFGSLATSPTLPGTGTVIRMYTADPPDGDPRQPVADEETPHTNGLALHAPHPNPSASTIHIPYTLPVSGTVELAVVDVLGREVRRLVEARQPEGAHTAQLDASALAPGVYVIRLRAGDETRTRRVTIVR